MATLKPILKDIGDFFDRLGGAARSVGNALSVFSGSSNAAGGARYQGRAGGGMVVPGSIYTVGEQGPETLVMGSSGGMVIPNGGSGGGHTINVYVSGSVQTERSLNLAIREGLRRLDREQR